VRRVAAVPLVPTAACGLFPVVHSVPLHDLAALL
jgi:hypothetical protein